MLGRLRRGGHELELTPKAMELLLLLAKVPGQPIPTATIVENVWHGRSVSDGVLKHLVWELRRALGDDAHAPRYIETLPRRGYRLIAPVEPLFDVDIAPRPDRLRRSRWAVLGALSGVAAVVVSLAALDLLSEDHPSTQPPIARPLTSLAGSEVDPALAPDGQHVAFAWQPPERPDFDVYTQPTDGGAPTPWTSGPATDLSPTWSPQGDELAFLREGEGSDRGVYLVSRAGAEPRRLDVGRWTALEALHWSPDGRWLVVSGRTPESPAFGLHRIAYATGAVEPLTAPGADLAGDFDPAISPDGRMVAFRRDVVTGSGDLHLVSIEGGPPRRLTRDAAAILGITWESDGSSVVFSSDRVPPRALWRYELARKRLDWLPLAAGFVADPAAEMRGDRLAVQLLECDSNIWEVGPTNEPRPIVASTRLDYLPRLSPDDRRLAFLTSRGGPTELWVSRADGAEPHRVTSFERLAVVSMDWDAPRGSFVAAARDGDSSDLFLVREEDGTVVRIPTPGSDETAPSFSSDGTTIYFGSNRTGRWEIWSRDLRSGAERRRTDSGGWVGQESADGRTLLFMRRDRPGIWERNLEDGAERLAISGVLPVDGLNWSVTETGIAFLRRARGRTRVERFDPRDGSTTALAELDRTLPFPPGLDLTSDGSRIFWSRLDRSESDLLLVTSNRF